MKSRFKIGILVIAATAIAAAAAAGWFTKRGPGAPAPGKGGPPVMPVETAPVEVGPASQEVGAVGSLGANESVIVRSEIAGRIVEIALSEGRHVDKGNVLVRLDPTELQAQVEQTRAAVELNRLNFERARRLQEEKVMSPQAFDEIEARLKESEASLSLSLSRLDKTEIRAPYAGRLGLRKVGPGDYVQPGQDIVNLEDIDSLKADFRIPAIHLGLLRAGQAVKARVDAYPDREFTGKIYAIDPRVDEATRTLLVRARIPNEGGVLRPGLFARISAVLEERPDALWIPEQAIVPMGTGKFVYRVVDGKALLTPVTIGQRRAGKVEVAGGLGAGATVVTGGQTKLFDGAEVRVVGPEGSAPPAASRS